MLATRRLPISDAVELPATCVLAQAQVVAMPRPGARPSPSLSLIFPVWSLLIR